MAEEQEYQNTSDGEDTSESPVNAPESDETENSEQEVESDEKEVQEASESENEASSEDDEEPEYDLLSDDEFTEYVASGKLPDDYQKRLSSRQSLKGTRDTGTGSTSGDETTSDSKSDEAKQSVHRPKKSMGLATSVGKEPASNPDDNATGNTANVDYKAVYEAIFKPFRANGKEITPRNINDVISLMQMGANYTKKMQLMAPIRKAAQSLINNNINEEELSFLIDLHKGDKEAIKELLKRNKVDTLDLDLENVSYKNSRKNIASDDDVDFQDAIQDVENSTEKIQEIFDKVWDRKSKARVLSDPKLLRALHEEIQLGRFDEVQKIVESEKTFGRYKGVDDVDIYIDVVTKLVDYQQKQQQQQQQARKKGSNTNTATKSSGSTSKPSLKSKAAPTRTKQSSKGTPTLTAKDIFSMSDEEFSRLNVSDLV